MNFIQIGGDTLKFAKLENSILRSAPKRVVHNERTIFNPPEDVLKELGYFQVQYTNPPDNPEEGKHYEPHWEQTADAIVQVWELVDDPVYEEPVDELAEAQKTIAKLGAELAATTEQQEFIESCLMEMAETVYA